ncbi:VanZ family protein [Thalassobacillus sp. C254]|uniref:VanZ family protein n=1 Tax=Thalassobacillus sp. C254 TaxID=1225341 RepID=UPI0018DDC3AD|nr:VanZ family protein [Thalassobacillus sp. C254]
MKTGTRILMYTLCLSWILLLIAFNLTNSISDLIIHGEGFSFHIDRDINWRAEFSVFALDLSDRLFIISKLGHFVAFFILTLLLLSSFRSQRLALAIALFFSIILEVLQPFFDRNGLIMDMVINLTAVYAAFFLYKGAAWLLSAPKEKSSFYPENSRIARRRRLG